MKGLHKVSRRYRCAACRPLHFSHVPAPLSPVPLYFSSLSLLRTALHYLNAWNRLPWCHWGRTIRKVMGGGGGGKKTKKNSCKGNCQEKESCKEEGKEKNSCRRKVQLWLFQQVWVSFRKSEFQKSTILPGTIWIKKNYFLLVEKRLLEPCFCFKLQLVYLQHILYTVYRYIHTYISFI